MFIAQNHDPRRRGFIPCLFITLLSQTHYKLNAVQALHMMDDACFGLRFQSALICLFMEQHQWKPFLHSFTFSALSPPNHRNINPTIGKIGIVTSLCHYLATARHCLSPSCPAELCVLKY